MAGILHEIWWILQLIFASKAENVARMTVRASEFVRAPQVFRGV